MKNKIVLFASILIIIIGVFFYYQFSINKAVAESDECCKTKEVKKENCCEEKTETKKDDCCSTEDVEESSIGSIYDLEGKWKDQNNNNFLLKNLSGKKVVMTMFFASCTYACPILLEDMNRFASLLPEDKRNEFNYILVSIDPERDTPEALNKLFKDKKLNENQWKFLTGNSNDIVELAAAIGFKFTKEKDGDFSHSNVLYILNERGEITYRHFGLNQPMNAAIAKIN